MFHHLRVWWYGSTSKPKKVIVITSYHLETDQIVYQTFHQPVSGATSGNQSHWRVLCAMADFASVSSCCNSSTWMLFPTWTSAGDDNWRMWLALFCVATLRWKLPKDGGFSNMGVGKRNVAGTCWLGYLNSTIGSPIKNDQFGSIFWGPPFFESRMFSAFWNQCSSNWIPSCATSLISSFANFRAQERRTLRKDHTKAWEKNTITSSLE